MANTEMSSPTFMIHLGGGLYLDSQGNLHTGPSPGLPVYDLGFQLPIDPSKVHKALTSFKEAVNKALADEDFKSALQNFGLATKLFPILSLVTKIAGFIAPVFFVASVVVDVLKLFGFLKDGPDKLEKLMQERFDELRSSVKAIDELIKVKDLRDVRDKLEGISNALRDYLGKLKNTYPDVDALEADLRLNRTNHFNALNDYRKVFDPSTWLAQFDRAEHTRVWPFMEGVLFTHPVKPANARPGAPNPPVVAMRPPDGNHFDHRLLVPMVLYAAETHLACIRGLVPEYRTVGDFREDLKTFSRQIETLAKGMREFVLARTIYRPVQFGQLNHWEVNDDGLGITPEHLLTVQQRRSRWSVGAMDLREHNDAFFANFLDEMFRKEFFGYTTETRHGHMNFRWMPPAKLRRAGRDNDGKRLYQITNPDECADAANKQSEQDYADLLASSGYVELIQVATLLRHEATEPDRSQTVAAEAPRLLRRSKPAHPVTVESSPRAFTPVHITAQASREPQDCAATVRITTQSIKRAEPVRYKIKLRTLDSIVSGQWLEPSYDQYQWSRYEPDFSDPGFKRLVLFTSNLALNDPLDRTLQLTEGSSPRETKRGGDVITMKAHTFDWWIPVRPPYTLDAPFSKIEHRLHRIGWNGPSLDNTPLAGNDASTRADFQPSSAIVTAPPVDPYIPGISWKGGAKDWDGERREPKETDITIKFSWTWEADRFTVELENLPSDRNYVVYVVVEELLVMSGQWLHTAVPVPITGQLTYVPQRFFDDERRAIEDGKRKLDEFLGRYAEVAVGGPLDPITGWLGPADLVSTAALERIFQLAQKHQPGLLDEVMRGKAPGW